VKEFTATFVKEKETKRTFRYMEETEGQPPRIGTLYVQQWALGSPAPERLRVTVEEAKEA